MELLAPAGSFSAFEAALEEGADALYVGAPGLNARAMSKEFSLAEIGSMIEMAHENGKKVYVAMNSLVKDDEIPLAVETLAILSQSGPDALIVQDPGLFFLARRHFPDLVLHASTLCSVHNSAGAQWYIDHGFERVVLARELSLDEIKTIYQRTGAALEVFVHGAMCFSYSGLCLFSSMHGGKSSLRGQCVQPCRRRYDVDPQRERGGSKGKPDRRGRYLFSMNDLSGIDLLRELRDAGVMSLKLEGRLKSAEYVRKTVRAYRLVLDHMDRGDEEWRRALTEAHRLLDESMGRDRSTGFLKPGGDPAVIKPDISGTSGLWLGKVSKIRRETKKEGGGSLSVEVVLADSLTVGDRVRLHNEVTGEGVSFSLKQLVWKGAKAQSATKGQKVAVGLPPTYSSEIGATFRGSLFKIDVSGRRGTEKSSKKRWNKSCKPIRVDRGKVQRILNDYGFHKQTGRKDSAGPQRREKTSGGEKKWWLKVSTLADATKRFPLNGQKILVPLNRENFELRKRWSGGKGHQFQKVIWSLPPVIHEGDLAWFRAGVGELEALGHREFQLGHYTQTGLFPGGGNAGEAKRLLYGDYTLNILNSVALRAAGEMDLIGVQFSVETDQRNFNEALSRYSQFPGNQNTRPRCSVGFLAYSRIPLFTARLDRNHFQYNKPFSSPLGERFKAERRDGLTRVRSLLPFTLLQYSGELFQGGAGYLVVDLSGDVLKKEILAVNALLRKSFVPKAILAGNFKSNLL